MANIVQDEHGTYRWVFEYSLWRDPTVFLTVFKVFGGVGLGIVVFMTVLDLINDNWRYVEEAYGMGSVRFTDFWEQDGHQYAIGRIGWPDGIDASIALVRP